MFSNNFVSKGHMNHSCCMHEYQIQIQIYGGVGGGMITSSWQGTRMAFSVWGLKKSLTEPLSLSQSCQFVFEVSASHCYWLYASFNLSHSAWGLLPTPAVLFISFSSLPKLCVGVCNIKQMSYWCWGHQPIEEQMQMICSSQSQGDTFCSLGKYWTELCNYYYFYAPSPVIF